MAAPVRAAMHSSSPSDSRAPAAINDPATAPRHRFASWETTWRPVALCRSTRSSHVCAHGARHAALYGPDRQSSTIRSFARGSSAAARRGAHHRAMGPSPGNDTPMARRWSGIGSVGDRAPKRAEKTVTPSECSHGSAPEAATAS